jgi:hypothetical protein
MLKIVNPILGLLFVNQVATGLFHGGVSHEAFEIMHEGGGILLALVGGLHVALNWSWIRTNFLKGGSTSGA